MPQLFKNNARALLASGILAGATSLTVEAGKADLFPVANTGTGSVPGPADWFKLVLQDSLGNVEIMYVRTRTAGSAILSNIIRGQEGTTARSWDAGSVCGLRITAQDIENSIAAGVNALLLNGNQTAAGIKTFNDLIVAAGGVTGDVLGNASTADEADKAFLLAGAGGAEDGATAFTQAAKDATTKIATTAFVDRMRSLLSSTTTGTAVLSDRGCGLHLNGNFTLPANVFQARDTFTMYNDTAGNISLLAGVSLTLRQAGTALTGNRVLAQRGLATVYFISPTEAVVSGAGLS